MKNVQQYKKALTIFSAYVVLMLTVLLYGSYRGFGQEWVEVGGLTPLIPSSSMVTEIALIYLLFSPLSALIGGFLGGYLLAPTFLLIHKRVLGSGMLYGIEDRPHSPAFNKLSRVYYPALFSISVNFLILFSAPWILDLTINPLEGPLHTAVYMPGFLVLFLFTIGLGTLFFSPVWFLTDAGIVYSNMKKVEGTDEPVEGRTVGGRFTDYLRGYAGIAVLLSYIQFLSFYFNDVVIPGIELGALNPLDIIITSVFFFGIPIFMLIVTIPSLIILDRAKEHRKRFIRNVAFRLGIRDFVTISFDKIKHRSKVSRR